jgi:hypothetical protein
VISDFWNGISGSNKLSNRLDYHYLQPPCGMTDFYVDQNISIQHQPPVTTFKKKVQQTTVVALHLINLKYHNLKHL